MLKLKIGLFTSLGYSDLSTFDAPETFEVPPSEKLAQIAAFLWSDPAIGSLADMKIFSLREQKFLKPYMDLRNNHVRGEDVLLFVESSMDGLEVDAGLLQAASRVTGADKQVTNVKNLDWENFLRELMKSIPHVGGALAALFKRPGSDESSDR